VECSLSANKQNKINNQEKKKRKRQTKRDKTIQILNQTGKETELKEERNKGNRQKLSIKANFCNRISRAVIAR
jgi:hypothetical protein